MRIFKGILLIALALLSLLACGGAKESNTSIADEVTLDPQRPTFIFFYTDP